MRACVGMGIILVCDEDDTVRKIVVIIRMYQWMHALCIFAMRKNTRIRCTIRAKVATGY